MIRRGAIKNYIIGFMLVILAYNVINQRIAMNRIQKEYSAKQEELRLLLMENEKLTEEVKASETDPSYMERLAREKLGFIKPGETTIVDTPEGSQEQ